MHKFFENQYELLGETMDDVAERIRSINHFGPATFKKLFAINSSFRIKREKKSHCYIKELLADHERIIVNITNKINLINNTYKDAVQVVLLRAEWKDMKEWL